MAVVAGLGIAWWLMRGSGGAPPDPSLFTWPTTPAAPAAAPVQRTEATTLDDGRARLARGDHAGALPSLRAAVEAAPESPEAWLALAKALWLADERAEAVTAFEKAARFGPPEVTTFRLEYALALEMSGQDEPAENEYRGLLSVSRESAVVQGLARVLTKTNRAQEAIPLLRDVVKANPQDTRAATALGMAYERAGDSAAAVAQYRDIVQRFPNAAYPAVLLTEALDREGQHDEALQLARAAVARNPREPLFQRGLGTILERQGEPAAAAAAYREYLRLNPHAADAAAITARAQALEARGGPPPTPAG